MSISKERAWQAIKDLSYERVTGTEDEKRAAEYLKAACAKLGVEAQIETYEIDQSTVEKAALTVGGKSYPIIGIGNTASTSDKGVEAPLTYLGAGYDADLVGVEGKICLISGRVGGKTIKKLKELGAVGFIGVHGGLWDNDPKLISEPRPKNMGGKKPAELPGVSMRIEDAEDLVKHHLGETACIILNTTTKKVEARNVVAVIPGTRLPQEEVAFSAHYDSVRWSKGSWDNASGSVILLEFLNHYVENKPDRTLRFIWCGSEEIGLKGSAAYCEQHKDELEKIIFNLNFDMAGVTLGGRYFTCTGSDTILHQMEFFSKVKGFALKTDMGMASSDSSSFAAAGVPAATLGQLPPQGGAQIHNYRDDMERMDPDTLYRHMEFALEYIDTVIRAAVNPIPREFSKAATEAIEKQKKWKAEMEKEDAKEDEKKDEGKEEKGKKPGKKEKEKKDDKKKKDKK